MDEQPAERAFGGSVIALLTADITTVAADAITILV
jgi:hypothetical protein